MGRPVTPERTPGRPTEIISQVASKDKEQQPEEGKDVTRRAALYARVCIDDGQNLTEQVETCREHAQDHGWHVVEELAEQGSGSNPSDLPQFNCILEMARGGVFDTLVVRDPYRLSRELVKLLAIEAELEQHGVRIEYIAPVHSTTASVMKTVVTRLPTVHRGNSRRSGTGNRQKAANTMTRRAVLCTRVSGDDGGKGGRNLVGQLDMCREYAQQSDWHIAAEMVEDDRGASGASFELPQLDRIREMASNGESDILVVRDKDRLSHNLAKQLIVEEELKRTGIQIEYALAEYPDTPEGRPNKHIRATIAEYEREKISERMTRGRQLKAPAGNMITQGPTSYG